MQLPFAHCKTIGYGNLGGESAQCPGRRPSYYQWSQSVGNLALKDVWAMQLLEIPGLAESEAYGGSFSRRSPRGRWLMALWAVERLPSTRWTTCSISLSTRSKLALKTMG